MQDLLTRICAVAILPLPNLKVPFAQAHILPTDRDRPGIVTHIKEMKCCVCLFISVTHMKIFIFSQLHTVVQACADMQNGKPL